MSFDFGRNFNEQVLELSLYNIATTASVLSNLIDRISGNVGLLLFLLFSFVVIFMGNQALVWSYKGFVVFCYSSIHWYFLAVS